MKNIYKILLTTMGVAVFMVGLTVMSMGSNIKPTDEDTITIDGTINKPDSDIDNTINGVIDIIDGEKVDDTIKTGLVKEDGHYVYYNIVGELLHDRLFTVNGHKYYFDENGYALTGTLKEIDGYLYYFAQNGKAYMNKSKVVDGHRYYFNAKGHAVKSKFITINNKEFYFDKNGQAITGKKSIKNFMCYFNDNGVLQRKIDKSKKMVCVTYDDGPSIYTPKILDILEKYDAKATFFVVGNRVDTYKKSTKRAAKMGCEIGNHTWTHAYLYKSGTSGDTVVSELEKCNNKIKEVTGKDCVVYRPCGGGVTDTIRAYCGKPMINWSVDTMDWKSRNSQSVQNEVYGKIKDGDVILMHDLYSSTAAASEYIIPYLVDQGFQLVTVSEMADCKGVNLQSGKLYYSFK